MIRGLVSVVRFWWRASAGYRLRPWLSPYLRWRMETYTGKPAASLRLTDFLRMAFRERRQLAHFFLWTGELNEMAAGRSK